MKILKYITLIMILWGIPTFFSYDLSIGSQLSYLTYGLLVLYYFFSKKNRPLFYFLFLGLLYFIISGVVFVDDLEFYNMELIKFFILIICGAELVRNTQSSEFFIFLILGALSIIIHAIMFQDSYGRYSGFYLDANGAGFVCIIGYCLSFSIKNIPLKLIGQFILTFAGILTFSRTFLLLWLLVSLTSIVVNKKNAINFGIGMLVILTVFSVASFLQLNTVRFSAFQSLLNNQSGSSISAVQEEGYRLDTWSVYYDMILDNPYFGNGFKTLSGFYSFEAGVHNTFLMILGEAGIFTFLIFVFIYLFMLKKSTAYFKTESHLFMLAFTLIGIMMTIHNYFENFLIMFTSMWLFIHVQTSSIKEVNEIIDVTTEVKT